MAKVEVIKAHPWGGKNRGVGDVYECPDKWAKVICAVGKAVPHIPAPVEKSRPDPEQPKPKRQYRRRTTRPAKTEEQSTYSRKDMQAED